MKRIVALVALSVSLWSVPAPAQPAPPEESAGLQRPLALTKASEDDFRRFMDALRGGRLGAEIQEVNIGVSESSVQVEMLRKSAPHMVVRLREPTSDDGVARFFDVEAVENVSAGDLERIGRLLDEIFTSDPFVERLVIRDVQPEDASHAGEFRRMHSASLEYTIAVIALGVLGLLASIGFLCLSPPTLEPKR